MTRDLVNISQAMTIALVSRRTIYNWINDGKLEYVRTAGGSIRIYRDTLFGGPTRTVPHSSTVARLARQAGTR